MNTKGYRVNGGLGFAINAPALELTISKADFLDVKDKRNIKEDKLQDLKDFIIKTTLKLKVPNLLRLEINSSDFQKHIGLGSGTATKMAIVEGIFILNEISYTHDDVIALSGRGGTSGIGINTYFYGGFVFDVGRKYNTEQILPSSSNEFKYPAPLTLIKGNLPDWKIGILIFNKKQSLSDQKEIDFFKKNANVNQSSVKNVVYEFISGLIPSIFENDYKTFCTSIMNIQDTTWKKREREIIGKKLKKVEEFLLLNNVDAFAFSSMGPSMLIMSKNIDKLVSLTNSNKELNFRIIETNFRNSGREIILC